MPARPLRLIRRLRTTLLARRTRRLTRIYRKIRSRARPNHVASYQPTILDLPPCERPRERLREHGPRYLNNAELVAILLRSGLAGENAISLAMRILAEFDGLAGLARVGYAELCEQRGLNHAKSSEIMAALELGRRIASLAPEERAQISCPQDAACLLIAEMEPLVQENLVVLLLNTRNQVVARRTIYIGTVNSSAVRPAEVSAPCYPRECPFHHRGPQPPVRRPDAQPGGHFGNPRPGRRRQAYGHRTA